jgi:hypothetical protein
MSVYLDSYNERLWQNDRGVSLDQTLTPRRVLHVKGGLCQRPGDEGNTRHTLTKAGR